MDLTHIISDKKLARFMFLESSFKNGYSDGKGLDPVAKQDTFDMHYQHIASAAK